MWNKYKSSAKYCYYLSWGCKRSLIEADKTKTMSQTETMNVILWEILNICLKSYRIWNAPRELKMGWGQKFGLPTGRPLANTLRMGHRIIVQIIGQAIKCATSSFFDRFLIGFDWRAWQTTYKYQAMLMTRLSLKIHPRINHQIQENIKKRKRTIHLSIEEHSKRLTVLIILLTY